MNTKDENEVKEVGPMDSIIEEQSMNYNRLIECLRSLDNLKEKLNGSPQKLKKILKNRQNLLE